LFAKLATEFELLFGQPHLLPELRRGLAAGAEGVALARMLAADLRHLEPRILIVLDDFHLVNDAAESEQAVDTLIRHLPPHGQLLITAREPPLLPATELLSDD